MGSPVFKTSLLELKPFENTCWCRSIKKSFLHKTWVDLEVPEVVLELDLIRKKTKLRTHTFKACWRSAIHLVSSSDLSSMVDWRVDPLITHNPRDLGCGWS